MDKELSRKRLVLIVDDEPRIGRVLSQKLTLSGYEPIAVTSGAEALEVIRTRKPDMMLLDMVMPRMDGFQVLRRLRAFSKLPVIAFSAWPENGPKAVRLGATDFLAKPFDLDDLVGRIGKRICDN